ncbi:MAG TPA: PBSX family phage terminase large subunit [Candidatus Mediterraneibacter vanvlietii]|nr:PBSX family phage terminase large subunit [Candidatus Mediterraneibacter vanvlietii]
MRQIKWSEKQHSIISGPYKHCLEVEEGTPRSGKTTAAVARAAWFWWNTPDRNHMVLAYNQEQAYRLVIDCDGLGLLHIFPGLCEQKADRFGNHILLHTPTGEKRIYYKGGGKADSHKAFTGLSFGSVYFCEINLLHMNAIQEAFRRTMAAQIRWHIADLNPPAPNHPVISEVFDVQDTLWTHWTPNDNPALTEERKQELFATLSKSKYLLARDWYGQRVIPKGVIYSMFDVNDHILSDVPKNEIAVEMFFSGDGGLTDATSISCNVITRAITNKGAFWKLYRVANWYYDGGEKALSTQAQEIVDNFIPYCRNYTGMRETCWKIDPACKALRMELQKLGVWTDKADNNACDVKGSRKGIEVGIEYLQSAIQDGRFHLIETGRFGHADFLREIGMYCTDDHGKPIDAYNHSMDEARYANNYFYKRYVL